MAGLSLRRKHLPCPFDTGSLILSVTHAREPELPLGRDPERLRRLLIGQQGYITHVNSRGWMDHWMLSGSAEF